MPSDADTIRIKRESESMLFALDEANVYAVGLGPKFVKDVPTGELAIVVFVLDKLPPAAVPPAQLVPAHIQGVPTDVVQLAAAAPHGVLTGGTEITAQSADLPSTGTLGCVARTAGVPDDQPPDVLLSCHHVLYAVDGGGSQHGADGNQVDVPSCSDCCSTTVATVLRGDRAVDAAIAKLLPGTQVRAMIGDRAVTGTVDLHPDSWAALPPDVLPALRAGRYAVTKLGETTGWTRGVVRCVDTHIHPAVAGARVTYHVVVQPVGHGKDFSDHGDSGSAICDERMRVVALLWGGPSTRSVPDGDKFTFGTPIVFVEKALRIRVATNPPVRVWRVPGEAPLTGLHRELAGTAAGRELLAAYGRHEDEVRARLREDRRFVVAWHRGLGPALVRALVDLAQRRAPALPAEVGGRPWRAVVEDLAAALRGPASPALAADVDRWAPVAAGLGGAAHADVLAAATAGWPA
jgi:hypothetical protein